MRYFAQILLIASALVLAGISEAKDIWYCPMHPNYTSDRAGSCPICGMALVKKQESDRKNASPAMDDHTAVHLNADQQQTLGIVTEEAAVMPLKRSVRASGYISTLHDLIVLQDTYVKTYVEYAQAYRDLKRFERTRRNWETHREIQLRMHTAEEELLKLGFNDAQIMKLQQYSWKTPWNQPELNFIKDGVNYWVVAALYEQDLGYVEAGQPVEIEIPAYHEHVKGVIRTVGQVIDPQTRTVNALIELQDYKGELVGNMFANVTIDVTLNDYVMVPKEALMDTGTRKIVYVETKPGEFTPREIKDPVMGDNGWGIKEGIKAGEQVVSSGNFLLDSESRMQASLQGGQP